MKISTSNVRLELMTPGSRVAHHHQDSQVPWITFILEHSFFGSKEIFLRLVSSHALSLLHRALPKSQGPPSLLRRELEQHLLQPQFLILLPKLCFRSGFHF